MKVKEKVTERNEDT